jgi:hypothetical protein
MTNRPIMGGQNPRQIDERQPTTPLRAPVIKAVTNVTNGNTTLWTVTADKFLFIRDFGVCNIAGANITITVYVVPEGGSAANTNKVYDGYTILANDSGTLTALVGSTLNPGDFIVAVTSSATGANFWLDGVEFVGGLADV